MISKVREQVQQTRQQFRDHLPGKFAKEFSKPVSAKQQTALFKSLGKSDLAALVASEGVSGALEMITSPARLNGAIQALENAYDQRFITKAKQLAHFMLTDDHGNKLLKMPMRLRRSRFRA